MDRFKDIYPAYCFTEKRVEACPHDPDQSEMPITRQRYSRALQRGVVCFVRKPWFALAGVVTPKSER